MSGTSYPTVREILKDTQLSLNLFKHDLESERWKHFVQWDILESLKEYHRMFQNSYEELEGYYPSSPTNTKEGKE